MSTEPEKKEITGKETKVTLDINVRKDKDESIEKTDGTQTDAQKELQRLKDELKRIETEKKAAEEKATKDIEVLKGEKTTFAEQAEDLRIKLETIAQKAFDAEKKKVIEKAKETLSDDKVKEIEESIDTPEKLKATMYMLEQLVNLKAGYEQKLKEEKEKQKPPETPPPPPSKTGVAGSVGAAGSAPLSSAQISGAPSGDALLDKEYENYAAMVADLRAKERAGDPEAKRILNELFKGWVNAVRADYKELVLPEIKENKPLKDIVAEGFRKSKKRTD